MKTQEEMRLELYELIEEFRKRNSITSYILGDMLRVHESIVDSWLLALKAHKEKVSLKRSKLNNRSGQLDLNFDFDDDDDDDHDDHDKLAVLEKAPGILTVQEKSDLVTMLQEYQTKNHMESREISAALGLAYSAYSNWINGAGLPYTRTCGKIQSFLRKALKREVKL